MRQQNINLSSSSGTEIISEPDNQGGDQLNSIPGINSVVKSNHGGDRHHLI
ncbi:MAG: hypothetical protein AAGJ08_13355 [Cyanobacteria bacterium P01_H01_bin.35]